MDQVAFAFIVTITIYIYYNYVLARFVPLFNNPIKKGLTNVFKYITLKSFFIAFISTIFISTIRYYVSQGVFSDGVYPSILISISYIAIPLGLGGFAINNLISNSLSEYVRNNPIPYSL